MNILKKIACVMISVLTLCSCSAKKDISSENLKTNTSDAPFNSDIIKSFSNELFKNCFADPNAENPNTLVSPISVYTAIAMVNNGADGQTRNEINTLLTGNENTSIESLNNYLSDYMSKSNSGDIINIANSMFIIDRKDITINQAFNDVLKNSYYAELFHGDTSIKTVEKINSWVNKKTNEMIPAILPPQELNPNTISIILNAVAFDGKWLSPYDPETDVFKKDFNNYDGSVIETDFMNSTENNYIQTKNAVGFVKYYEPDSNDNYYCFVGILPNENIDINKYVESLSANDISDMVSSCEHCDVNVNLPKFTFDVSYKLPKTLSDMGMPTAFTPSADFSGMAESSSGNGISIGDVIHKTHIEVDEKGTKAAAVTGIIMQDNAIAVAEEPKIVTLDRPFVFAIYDKENDIPLFIGSVKILEN